MLVATLKKKKKNRTTTTSVLHYSFYKMALPTSVTSSSKTLLDLLTTSRVYCLISSMLQTTLRMHKQKTKKYIYMRVLQEQIDE